MALRETEVLIDILAETDPLREMNELIGDSFENLDQLEASLTEVEREIRRMGRNGTRDVNGMRDSMAFLDQDARIMQRIMNLTQRGMTRDMGRVRSQLIRTQYGFFTLGREMGNYSGTTDEFMDRVRDLGNEYRRANDEMINANTHLRQSILQQVGTFMNMTTQARRISDVYTGMRNPLYNVNQFGLRAADGLNRLANSGNAAQLALEQLGPNATMKQLQDRIMLINQGMMRFQMVAMGAAITSFFFYKAMHKLAMQNDEYATSFNTMVAKFKKAIQPMVSVFISIATAIFDFASKVFDLIDAFNQAHPTLAKFIQGTMLLIPALMLLLSPLAVGIGLFAGFRAALFSVWPLIAPLVTGVAAMSGTIWLLGAALVGIPLLFMHLYKTSETFRNGLQNAVTTVQNFAKQVVGFLQPAIDKVVQQFNVLKDAIGSAINGDFSKLGEIFKQLIPTIIGFLVGGLPGLVLSASRFIPSIIQGIDSNAATLSTKITEIANMIVGFIRNNLPLYLQAGLQILTNIIQGISQSLPLIVSVLVRVAQTILTSIVAVLPSLLQAGIQILQAIINGILSMLSALIPVVLQLANSLIMFIQQNAPILLQAGVQILMTLINGIVQMLPTLITVAIQLITTIVNTLGSYLPVILQTGIRLLMTLLTGILQMLPNLIQTALKLIVTIINTLAQNLPKILQAGVKILTMLIQGIVQLLPVLINTAIKLIVTIVKAIASNLPQILKAGVDILKSLIKGIISIVQTLFTTVVNSIIKPLIKYFSDIDLVEVGANIIKGLAKGITSAGKFALDKAKEVAGGIKDAVTGFFDIHSPSRVMIEVGGYITEGLGLGIEDQIRMLERSAANVSDVVTGDFALSPDTSSTTSTTSNNKTLVFRPEIKIEGANGNSEDLERTVRNVMDETYQKLISFYDTTVVI